MKAHEAGAMSAAAAAAAAAGHPPPPGAAGAAAGYPGHPGHPGHPTHHQLMDMYSGMAPATAINTMDWKNTSQVGHTNM